MQRISSRQNSLVARVRAAARGDEPALVLLDGEHLVDEALSSGVRVRHAIVAAQASDADGMRPLLERLRHAGVDVAIGSAPVMAAISPVRSPSRVVAIADRSSLPAVPTTTIWAHRMALVLVACDVQDPGNLGAIVRVAEAAGATAVVAAGSSADPFGWKALRGSMGSALRVPSARVQDAVEAVREARAGGCRIAAMVPRGGHPPSEVNLTGSLAILIGGEGPGLSGAIVEAADLHVTIPMQPPVESLNAAVTAALVAYEVRRQRLA